MAEMIAGAAIALVSFFAGCIFMVLVAVSRREGDDG